jgi:uncharacterized protein (DUF1778 family)
MLSFRDQMLNIDEPNEARMNFRTKPRIKETIRQAAALAGVDDTTFVINAAFQAAKDTIAAHEQTVLAQADMSAFFTALDNPPEPNKSLRAIFRLHDETVVSK